MNEMSFSPFQSVCLQRLGHDKGSDSTNETDDTSADRVREGTAAASSASRTGSVTRACVRSGAGDRAATGSGANGSRTNNKNVR